MPWKSKTIKKIVPWNCWLKITTINGLFQKTISWSLEPQDIPSLNSTFCRLQCMRFSCHAVQIGQPARCGASVAWLASFWWACSTDEPTATLLRRMSHPAHCLPKCIRGSPRLWLWEVYSVSEGAPSPCLQWMHLRWLLLQLESSITKSLRYQKMQLLSHIRLFCLGGWVPLHKPCIQLL